MRGFAPAVWLLAFGLGCSTALDLERARAVLDLGTPPPPPVLVESPPADLPPLEGLQATSGELRRVPLKWEPVVTGDVAGYAVERALEPGGGFQRVATLVGRFETSFTDRGRDLAAKHGSRMGAGDLGDGHSYHYRVRPFDSAGRLSAPAPEPVAAATAPPPPPPALLTIYSQLPRQMALTWSPVEDPHVAGYVVYRSPSARGGFLPVARLEGAHQTTYVDRGLGPLRVFYYRVAALNAAGGEGEATPAEVGVTKPEPLPPTGLRVVNQRLGANTLGWEPNVEADLAGYRLLRVRAQDRAEELVAALPADATRAEDRAVGAGERVSYRLTAFDRDDLESAPSRTVEVTSVDYGLRAEARDGALVVRWDPQAAEGFATARVLLQGRFGEKEIGRVSEPFFVHRDAEAGRRYRYRVVLVRADGSEAPPSAPVEAVWSGGGSR
jgi:fibronectin type 3 domain-containing protein